MADRPILFSAPMVRAILVGRKTQTRRVVKPRRDRELGCELAACELAGEVNAGDYRNAPWQPGDTLWVRESTIRVEEHGYAGPVYVESDEGRACLDGGLAPSEDDCTEVEPHELRIRPSIHMPRWASRITLEVTGVRVERLQDISEADSLAEGVDRTNTSIPGHAKKRYSQLWEQINGPDSWAANPWVWVIEFRRVA